MRLDVADLREQILYNENSPNRSEQEALEKRVDRSEISVRLYCPGCGHQLLRLDCDFCNVSCGILHQRILKGVYPDIDESEPRIETDTRVISLYATGYPRRELIRFQIRCLSCYEVLQRNEKCLSRCGLRTYLSYEIVDGWLLLRLRWYKNRDFKEFPITPGHVFEKLRESALTKIPQTPATDLTFEPPIDTEHPREHVEHNGEHPPENVEHNTEHNESLTDDQLADRFIENYIVADAEHFQTAEAIVEAYHFFTEIKNATPLADRKLYKHLQDAFGVEKTRRRVENIRQYGFLGIRLQQ